MALIEILDDEARFRQREVTLLDQWEALEGPEPLELRTRDGVREIDHDRLERRLVLVERDQDLPAEGGQGMIEQLQEHTGTSFGERGNAERSAQPSKSLGYQGR